MTEYPNCPRCGETLYQGHLCAGWPDRFTASTPPSSAPENPQVELKHYRRVLFDASEITSSAPEGGLRVRACRGHFHPCWFHADGTEGDDISLPGDPFKTAEACQAAIDADARERNDPPAASHPHASAPETRTPTHSHRCMRCQKEFPCVTPLHCEAGPVVLPRIVYLDIFGRIQMRDHCRNVLYKGFVGLATFDTEAKVYHGEVEGIRDVVTFEADDEDGIESAFQASVDDYLEMLDVPIGKHGPYDTHTNGDGSPVLIPPASHSPGTAAPEPTCDCATLRKRLATLRQELRAIAALFGATPCYDDGPPSWTNGIAGDVSLIELLRPFAEPAPTGTPAPAGGTLTACQRAVYYCMACPLTFPDAASSNAHHDATGHNQTWRPVMAFHARNPAATAASGIGTTEDADCFDELTESAAVNDVLASMARDYPGSVARVVRYLREVKADRDRMDWWEAHLPESIYWKDRGGNLKQGWTFRRFTDAARSSTESPQ